MTRPAITRDDLLGAEDYERRRDEIRRRIMAVKRRRRVPCGEHATFHFESRETMIYQIHEMLRIERSWDRPGAVDDELEAYAPLVPRGDELVATLMFEYETPEERDEHLTRLVGIDRHVWLQVGDTEPVRAQIDDAQVSDTRISSVQYVRWSLDAPRRELLRRDGTVVRVGIDHPHYTASAVLGEETRRELASDLTEE
ncbi:MAG: DUF3501 family protein [Acidobacteria bacterium]|nr:MAG: DUF3501 family protein [Acidobacteriota bacterium]